MVEEVGKIFVGGLSWSTTEDSLKNYFTQFGEISSSHIMRDPMTQRPRGFAFVKFADPGTVQSVCEPGKTHILDGKQIDPKPALLQSPSRGPLSTVTANRLEKMKSGVNSSLPMYQGSTKKIFVGGIAAGTMKEDIEHYFSTYGTVHEVVLMMDKQSQRPRGFGFVTMDSDAAVEHVVGAQYHQINGKTVEAKKAFPRPGEPGYIPSVNSPVMSTTSPISTRQTDYRAFNSGQSPFPGYPYNATPAGLNQSYGAVGSQQGFAGQPAQVYSQQQGMSYTNQAYSSQTSRFPTYANTTMDGSLATMGGLSGHSANYDPFSSGTTQQQQQQSHLLGGFASQLGVGSSAFSNQEDPVPQQRQQQQILSQFTNSSPVPSTDPLSVAFNSTPITSVSGEDQSFPGPQLAYSQPHSFSNEYSAIGGFRQDSLSAEGGVFGRGGFPGF